jgi:hypothetical protein
MKELLAMSIRISNKTKGSSETSFVVLDEKSDKFIEKLVHFVKYYFVVYGNVAIDYTYVSEDLKVDKTIRRTIWKKPDIYT